jgi:chemotaxis protein MotB
MPRLEEAELFENCEEVLAEQIVTERPSRAPWILLVLTLLSGAGVASWLFFQLQHARGEAATTQRWLESARKELGDARAQRADLAARLGQAEVERRDLLAVKEELSQDVQAKDAALAALRGDLDQLQEKMKAEIEKGNVRLSQEHGRIKVDMVDEILFDVGDSAISKQGEEVLSRVGGVLAGMTDKHILVSGHTDDLPISPRLAERFPTNWELSAARAITVVRFLEERARVPGRRLVAAAHSQYDPLSTGKSAQSRARNRRIEILLTPEIDPDRKATVAAATPAAPAPRRAAAGSATVRERRTASRAKR